MGWRYYVQRAGSGEWLDNDAALADVDLTYNLSAPSSGKASIPTGLVKNPIASDGQKTWGKWNTLLYAEEDGELSWVGICTSASPGKTGLELVFIGTSAWMQRVPFTGLISVWRTNVFDVVRSLIHHTVNKKPNIDYAVPTRDSKFYVGDPRPPAREKAPPRRSGQSMTSYYASAAYKQWKKDDDAWVKAYGNYGKFEIAWYEAPYVGEEIDSLAKEAGFEYREVYSWRDRGALIPRITFDFDDRIVRRREDIALVDGLNIAERLVTKDDDDPFANHVIGLGAGEGSGMLRAEAGDNDGRLYQAEYVYYKGIRKVDRLRALAQADWKIYSSKDPKIDTVVAWDVKGFQNLSTLRVGDEIQLKAQNYDPVIDQWVRVVSINRKPGNPKVELTLEVTR